MTDEGLEEMYVSTNRGSTDRAKYGSYSHKLALPPTTRYNFLVLSYHNYMSYVHSIHTDRGQTGSVAGSTHHLLLANRSLKMTGKLPLSKSMGRHARCQSEIK